MGHEIEFDDTSELGLRRVLRDGLPDAFVIDLSRRPYSGRHVAQWLRSTKWTRMVPIVFVDGEREKVATIKEILPDATYTSWGRIKMALPRAIARPPAAPVVPPSSIYSGRPTAAKMGLKDGMRVALLGAPPGFARVLEPLPKGVKLSAKPDSACDLFITVVRSQRELGAQLVSLARVIDKQVLWMVWPKKASKVASDVNGNVVRETGLASGWVDFKVCSVDDTWSGLAFKRRGV